MRGTREGAQQWGNAGVGFTQEKSTTIPDVKHGGILSLLWKQEAGSEEKNISLC